MKITAVREVWLLDSLFVEVDTDEGITGLGQVGIWAYPHATLPILETMREYLVGEDPLRIEHHQQYMYRWNAFRGAAISSAISAIDIALWDIAGQHHGSPIYRLLGGPTRSKLRAYTHVEGPSHEKILDLCRSARDDGFTAIGHLTPFVDAPREQPYFETHARRISDAVDHVAAYRETVGIDVDLCIEIHRRLTPSDAVVLGSQIEQFHPMFYEDPTLPDNIDAMKWIADRIRIPIATGERLHTLFEFQMLLQRGAASFVRPDVCLAGGITQSRKIAALAEASYVQVVPHNPLGPVCTAASIHLGATIPNLEILEYPAEHRRPELAEMFEIDYRVEDGFVTVPDTPGLGVRIRPGAPELFPRRTRKLHTRLRTDGSVMDQ